jgi:hypothetical protein
MLNFVVEFIAGTKSARYTVGTVSLVDDNGNDDINVFSCASDAPPVWPTVVIIGLNGISIGPVYPGNKLSFDVVVFSVLLYDIKQ